MSRKSPPAYPKVPPHTFRLKKGKVCERRPCSIESYKDASSKCVSAEDRKMKHLRPMSPTAREASSHTLVNADEIEHAKRQSPRVSDESSRSNFTFDPLRCLPIANLDPPITQTILTELDVPRIMDDLAFRHHLNFGLSITFRPNLNGPGAQERTKRAIEYWDAMAKELAVWLAPSRRLLVCPSSRPAPTSTLTQKCQSFDGGPRRLPRMIEAIREISKSLLPVDEWSSIDARLDVELLTQEMKHGLCDFTNLSDWLGSLLRRFCSPARDHLIDEMTSAIQFGVLNAQPRSTANGLMSIFDILQTMKLDNTNCSLMDLRLVLVNDSVTFERMEFLRRMSDGWDTRQAHMWFRGLRLRNDLSSSDFHLLTTAVVDLIVRNCAHFPSTFTLDYIRLRTLQVDFQTLRFQAACRWTFAKTLQMLGWGRPCPQKSYNDLYAHVSAITSDPGLIDIDLWHSCVALEIVRDVYRTCSNCELPSCKDLNFARDCLLESCKPTTAVFVDLADSLALRLHELVDREMDTIGNLSPVQIMNRQLPQKPGFDVPNEHTGLVHIAKRISHIVELHWRVWAPILYEQHIVGEGSV